MWGQLRYGCVDEPNLEIGLSLKQGERVKGQHLKGVGTPDLTSHPALR